MKRKKWIVGKFSIRPAGKPDECFYCHQKVGEEHKEGCCIRSKTVVIKLEFKIVKVYPEDWDEDLINFHLNDSSWCMDNILDDLKKVNGKGCICSFGKGEYIREATEEDEENNIKFVEKEKS